MFFSFEPCGYACSMHNFTCIAPTSMRLWIRPAAFRNFLPLGRGRREVFFLFFNFSKQSLPGCLTTRSSTQMLRLHGPRLATTITQLCISSPLRHKSTIPPAVIANHNVYHYRQCPPLHLVKKELSFIHENTIPQKQ